MSDLNSIGQAPSVPTVPELLTQMRTLDAQIQHTDREIAARPYPAHPQGAKESAEWAQLQAWWVNNHWRPFVTLWNRGMQEVHEYDAGTRGPDARVDLIKALLWVSRMREQYRSLRQSAGASFYITISTVAGLSFDDIGDAFDSATKAVKGAAKGAVQSVKSVAQKAIAFVKHPPGWFATIFPLMTMENQRYWAGKIGGSTGEQLYDAGVKAVAAKYLGPQGPALVETYNKVTEDAANGNLNALEIISKAPEIVKLAAASNQGPDAFRAAVADTKSAVKVSGEGEEDMTYNVGAEGQSYPEVASRAVQSVHSQHRSPLYGYTRSGVNQKILLFPRLEDARAWFDQAQAQPDFNYVAVFSASNLRAPIAGMERFVPATVSGDQVGNWWPFLLGLPLGGLGGYFLRRWQEGHPGQALPFVPPGKLPAPQIPPPTSPPAKTSGDPWLTRQNLVGQGFADGYGYMVGCPSYVGQDEDYDDEGYGPPHVGGPWLDVVGQDYDDDEDYGYSVGCPSWVGAVQADSSRRREWPQTKALIDSAIAEVQSTAASYPAEAYVWQLDAPTSGPYAGRGEGSVIMQTGTTNVVPFSSQAAALDYLREQAQKRPVALAMFERSSKHWPNPVAWRKSDQPEHEQVIAQHVASQTPTHAGAYVGADTAVNDAVNEVRLRAQQLAEKREGNVIGVIHTSKDNLWHSIKFSSPDDADDWLNSATQDQNAYTYAAYFDKNGDSWPRPYIEKIGGFRQPKAPQQRFRRAGTVGEWMP